MHVLQLMGKEDQKALMDSCANALAKNAMRIPSMRDRFKMVDRFTKPHLLPNRQYSAFLCLWLVLLFKVFALLHK